jgi:hypothetical protein
MASMVLFLQRWALLSRFLQATSDVSFLALLDSNEYSKFVI